eukprot:g45220.t1
MIELDIESGDLQAENVVVFFQLVLSFAGILQEARDRRIGSAPNIHYKLTDSHSYLDYTSSHPASCIDSVPFSQFLHLCHIRSDEANFDKEASKMSTFFLNQGFPSSVFDRVFNQ